ncbi:P-loop containing nucleoside triphosphate hydrolase protein [Rhizopogon vinicolor AM-OR11-026]|uniref:ATP-dependent RNA helicase n=1 Tax=Rhizopogon vinicolor AM-OR11-026 TaxID=1314800 RepID=A0A1B7MHT5_9AGAM|nr:P-loop containing nucleoside triphosphate hydrolase protein [Rhizopogon vinicolor AM-OR11-026]
MSEGISSAPTVNPQGKTRAKTRYLKRKKSRRKARKSAAPKQANNAAPSHEETDEGDSDNNDPQSDSENDMLVEQPPNGSQSMNLKETREGGREERPKKKQKLTLSHLEGEGNRTDIEGVSVAIDNEVDASLPAMPLPPKSPELHMSLPVFSLPALPVAPPKSILALQGLDQALVEAEVINPSSRLPITPNGDDTRNGLSERTRRRLLELGITELFAVQIALLPFLLGSSATRRSLYAPFDPPQDVCVSAPTGSGKTLAYVLPIVEILSTRVVTHLRALIVLPTRDLVMQVRETLEAVSKGRGLKIGVATGQHSFAHEQSQLVSDKSTKLSGGSSKIDILICTPGRLIDHLNGTTNFSLQHLRFLVIDEADRLLAQSFQDWLAQVLAATQPSPRMISETTENDVSFPLCDSLAPAFLHLHREVDLHTEVEERKNVSCQKLMFSATLTSDPGKLAALDLRNPKYFVVQGQSEESDVDGIPNVITERFTMPEALKEHMIICEASQKPMMLFHLVHNYSVRNALVFTKSSESASRLVRLIEFFEAATSSDRNPIVVRSYSSDLPVNERRNILEKFKAQEVHLLICSDLISRGIDISHVSHVVSYDTPVDMRKYVHRVGRTARAGRTGDAWTLVEEQEAHYFKSMLRSAGHLEKVKRMRVSEKDTAPLSPAYEIALQNLRDAYTQ